MTFCLLLQYVGKQGQDGHPVTQPSHFQLTLKKQSSGVRVENAYLSVIAKGASTYDIRFQGG